jgi:hypothetical protein
MTHHHNHDGHHHDHHHDEKKSSLPKHTWKFVAVVILMLAAMLIYVLTMNEAIQPDLPAGSPPISEPMPAAP